MTDWKPGDRFRLEATGTVAKAQFGLDLELPVAVDFDEDRTTDGAYGFDLNWFNAHATKIQPPCGAITFKGAIAAMPCGLSAVQRVTYPGDETRYFCPAHRIEAEDL